MLFMGVLILAKTIQKKKKTIIKNAKMPNLACQTNHVYNNNIFFGYSYLKRIYIIVLRDR